MNSFQVSRNRVSWYTVSSVLRDREKIYRMGNRIPIRVMTIITLVITKNAGFFLRSIP
ncbi:hypothetical protein ES703_48548 [subsurface metagenome]